MTVDRAVVGSMPLSWIIDLRNEQIRVIEKMSLWKGVLCRLSHVGGVYDVIPVNTGEKKLALY